MLRLHSPPEHYHSCQGPHHHDLYGIILCQFHKWPEGTDSCLCVKVSNSVEVINLLECSYERCVHNKHVQQVWKNLVFTRHDGHLNPAWGLHNLVCK